MYDTRLEYPLRASVRGLIRWTLLLGLIHLAMPRAGAGQVPSSVVSGESGGYGYFQGGVLGLDLGALNASLGSAGFPGLDATVPTWGGAGCGVLGRFHLCGAGHGALDPSATTGVTRVSLSGGYGLARAKYEALSVGGLTILPALGLGGGALNLRITDFETPTFGEVLDDPARSSVLSTGWMLLLNAGVALDYRIALTGSDDGSAGGIVAGLEGGYLYAPGETTWTLDDANAVTGGPDLGIQGFYLWISLGGWGRSASR